MFQQVKIAIQKALNCWDSDNDAKFVMTASNLFLFSFECTHLSVSEYPIMAHH